MLKDLVNSETLHRAENYCAGCGIVIRDRFYLLAADRAWHGQCLRCCKCSQTLDTELSCFARDGNIYCKEDYFRLFSSRRCARCGNGLSSSELVMRARELIFHVECFSCALCGVHFSTGDTAAIRGGRVLCGDHYDAEILSDPSSVASATAAAVAAAAAGVQFYPSSPQKGRPRKRKTPSIVHHNHHQQQQHQHQHHSEESSDILERESSTPLRMDPLHTDLGPSSLDLTTYDGSQSPGSGSSLSGQTRTKRMRTSFKHHQLRTMKSYFAINQNPDAKDLKQLAQKTGLSKRVLQVWFQNARAKWRRNVMRQDGSHQPGGGPSSLGPGTGDGEGGGGGMFVSGSGGLNCSGSGMQSGGPPSVQSNSSNMESGGITPSHTLEDIHHMTFAELY